MKKNATKLAVIIVCIMFLVSMVGTYLVQTNGMSVKQETITCTLNELTAKINANLAETGREQGDLLTKGSDAQICMTVYTPKNASASNPVPAVVCAHGWNNSKEMQLCSITELTKRGFVVISLDLAGHGRTDVGALDESGWGNGNTEGALAAVEYALSLPQVDPERVGVTGHSAGDLALTYAIQQINVEGSLKHVSSFYCPAGTMAAFLLSRTEGITDNFLFGVACGRYDELDTKYFGTYDLKSSFFASMIFGAFAPGQAGADGLPLGEWYNAEGKIDAPAPGDKLAADSAIIMWNPNMTHPQGVYSKIATELEVEFFYAAYGVPEGASYVAADKQTWQIGSAFETIGLVAFFASAIVFAAALLKTKRFSDLIGAVPEGEALPSIKSPKEIVAIIVTFVPIIYFAYTMYFKCFDAAPGVISSNSFPDTVNGIAWYTAASGLFLFVMISVNYLVRKLFDLKSGAQTESLLVVCKVDGAKKFFKTILFCLDVIFLMYIPCVIAYFVFGVNFGISVYVVGVPRLQWLPEILTKYLPLWLLFAIPNAALNARTRFKEIPEWASTLFCVLANFLPIAILTWVNYSCLINTGATKYTFGDPTIMSFNLFAPMIFVGISSRWFYKKTGNAWAGAIINATILTLMATTLTRHITDFALFL